MSEEIVKLPDKLIPLLQCSICKHIISCGPVYVKKNNEHTCGRCVQPRNSRKGSLRNSLYEEIGKFLIFPCKYKNLGCKSELKWDESLEHEKNCIHSQKIFSCPILPKDKCNFQGPKNEIFEHCNKNHKNFVVSHPFKVTSYSNFIVEGMKTLVKSSNKKVLIKAHDFLFMIHFKICFISEKTSICISLVDDLKISEHFEFQIEIFSNRLERKKYFLQRVIPESELFDDKHAVDLSFNTGFEIKILKTDVKCLNCQKVVENITYDEMKFCCDNWNFIRNSKLKGNKILEKCVFFREGCKHLDTPENIDKHEIFFCKYIPIKTCRKCENCIPLKYNKSTFDHIVENHHIDSFVGNSVEISSDIKFDFHYLVLKNDKGKFLWKYEMNIVKTLLLDIPVNEYIIFNVNCLSNLPANKDKKLKFVAKVKFLPNGPTHKDELKRTEFEYFIGFKINPMVKRYFSNYLITLSIE